MKKYYLLTWVLLGLVLLSLAVNLVIFLFLFGAKKQVVSMASQAAEIVRQIQAQSEQSLPVSVTIDETFTIPVNTTVPVKADIDVPIIIPVLGQAVTLRVPINTSVPVAVSVQVPIKKTISVGVKLANSPIGDVLQQLQDFLYKVEPK